MTEIENLEGEFCPECGKRHNIHYAQSHELPAGTMLCSQRYIVGGCIGTGGFSITYIGFDTKMNRKVVIKETYYRDVFYRNCLDKSLEEPLKVTYDNSVSLEEIMNKTIKECRSLSEAESLNNIVKVYDWFSENNTSYIIMEYINGNTLYDWVQEKGAYTWQSLYRKIKPLMKSLSILNRKGVIHRDIKPSNIMIKQVYENKYEFVLIDFGLARSENAHTLGTAGMSFTPGYAPIEQRNFTKNDGTYTDVYALAATIYYALVGEIPESKVGNDVYENFPKLKELVFSGRISNAVGAALDAALQPDYTKRCQTVDDFVNMIERVRVDELIDSEEQHIPFPISENKGEVPSRPGLNNSRQDDVSNDFDDEKNHKGRWLKVLMAAVLVVVAMPLLALAGVTVYNHFYPPEPKIDVDTDISTGVHYLNMPSVVGLTYEQCELVLKSEKFNVKVHKINSKNMEENRVAHQDPAAGTKITADDGEKYKVDVYVVGNIDTDTDSYVLSPNCLDKDIDEAVKICEDLGLKAEYYYQNSHDSVGDIVIYQSPMYGEYISPDVTITLIVSKGLDKSEFVDIEDYFGLKYTDVKMKLEEKGLTVKFTNEERDDYNEGVIIGQSIEKGTVAEVGSEISFVVVKEKKTASSASSSNTSSNASSTASSKAEKSTSGEISLGVNFGRRR